MTRKEDFLNRLNEMGLEEGKHFEMKEIEKDFYLTSVPYHSHFPKTFDLHTSAIQGLIYHFSNRKWISSDAYMYIEQN